MSTVRTHTALPRAHSQRGMTLVEVMIAMVVGLFLLAGVMTILSGTRRAFGTQNQLAQLQDNERLAMTVMTDVIQAAGYFPDPKNQPALPASGLFGNAQSIAGTSAASGPDSISIRYTTGTGDGVLTCDGGTNNSGADQLYEMAFSLNAQGQLQCAINGNAPEALVGGISNLVILYGVNTLTGGTCPTDTYLRASQMNAAQWGSVCSVKIQLSFTNPNSAGQAIQFTRLITIMRNAGVS